MKNQYVITNPEVLRYNKYTMSLHQSKLKLIRGRKNAITCSTPVPNFRSNRKFIHKGTF